MTAGDPPPFSSREYWDDRFAKDQNHFDWLHDANVLDGHLVKAIADCKEQGIKHPQILHIGCGTSLLSLLLRTVVEDPTQIWNVDFSRQAVEIGKGWEQKLCERDVWSELRPETKSLQCIKEVLKQNVKRVDDLQLKNKTSGDSSPASNISIEDQMMHWEAVDLLSLQSISAVLGSAKFDIIIEKSCSDAIACGDDVRLSSLDRESSILSHYTSPQTQIQSKEVLPTGDTPPTLSDLTIAHSDTDEERFIHPVSLLAIHLAHFANPGCKWMMLTFSEDRIIFKPSPFRKPHSMPAPLPDPIKYWDLTMKQAVATVESDGKVGTDGTETTVYRPEVYHYIMILERRSSIDI